MRVHPRYRAIIHSRVAVSRTTAPRTSWDSVRPPLATRIQRWQFLLAACGTARQCQFIWRVTWLIASGSCSLQGWYAKIILRSRSAVVGGEETPVANEINEKLYQPGDFQKNYRALGAGEHGTACWPRRSATWRLQALATSSFAPTSLRKGNAAAAARTAGDAKPFGLRVPRRLVFLSRRSRRQTLRYGVVKMNVDTDTQYAFTRPIAGHMFDLNYDGVLKVDAASGASRRLQSGRSYSSIAAEASMSRGFAQCNDLHCAGKSSTH